MTVKRAGACLLVLALLMGACSSGEGSGTELDLGEAKGGSKEDGRPPGEDAETNGGKSPTGNKARGSNSSTGGIKAKSQRGSATEDGGGEDDGSSAFAPAAGTYVYDQTGYEEFCDATSCDREDLPPTQDVTTTHDRRSPDEVVVITEAQSSDSRFTKTTTRHSRARALITNVQIRFNYQGVRFNNSYQPDPPVEAVRYPLQEGSSWSGSWKDSTSGRYSIEVGAKRSVMVGNATVQAFPVRTRTTFSGEFEGRANVVTWIDPATAAIVKLEGEIRVQSVFGRYGSEFSASLRSAPGY
jgi:hypothetical protein